MTPRELIAEMRGSMNAIEAYAGRCVMTGPADQLRDAIRRAAVLVKALDAALGEAPQAGGASADLSLVLDAAQQHANDSQVWKGVSGPAYFEANLGRDENRRRLREAIRRLREAPASEGRTNEEKRNAAMLPVSAEGDSVSGDAAALRTGACPACGATTYEDKRHQRDDSKPPYCALCGSGQVAASEGRERAEPLSWRCFHCDEVFADKAEAAEHFGADEYKTPACRMSSWHVKELRELEAANAELRLENERLENDARLWHESEADRIRRIGHVAWWQELDYREGEKIVLQERVRDLESKLSAAPPSGIAPPALLDEKEHPIWKLANRIDGTLDTIRHAVSHGNTELAVEIATTAKWISAEMRGEVRWLLASPPPAPPAGSRAEER